MRYIVTPDFGEGGEVLVLKRCNVIGAIAAAASLGLAASLAVAAPPGLVVLRLENSDFEFRGTLRSFDGDKYVVESSSFGILSLSAAKYSCEGEGCSDATPAPSIKETRGTMDFTSDGAVKRISILGPASISHELMPALIQDYARSIGGGVSQLVGSNPEETAFRLFDSKGTALAEIGLTRSSPAKALADIAKGQAAIALSTRPVAAAEATALAAAAPAASATDNEHIIALDGTAVIVAPGSKIATLPLKTITGIFSGQIRNWSEVGLPPAPINIYVASDGAGSTDGIDSFLLDKSGTALSPSATRLANETEVSDAVTRDPAGIGLTSHALLRNAKAIGVGTPCGITTWPTEFGIKAEEYPLGRRVYLYTAGRPAMADAEKLIKFTSSDAAQVTIGSSQFMNQSVVTSSSADQSARVAGWLENGTVGLEDQKAAQVFLTQVKEASRLSLTFRFAMGSSQLDAKGRDDLGRLAALLATPEFKTKVVLLAGFTDSVGSAAANARLSQRRAEQVMDALFELAPKRSLDAARIRTQGYGAIAPVVCNDEETGSQKNRRVEVWVYDQPPKAITGTPQEQRSAVADKKRGT